MTELEGKYPKADDPRVLAWVARELPQHVGPSAPLAMLRELGGTFERKAQIKKTLADLTEADIDAFKVGGGATPASVIMLAAHEVAKSKRDPEISALNEWLRNNPQLDSNGVQVRVDVDAFAKQERKGRKYQYPAAELEGLIAAQAKLTAWADLVNLGVHTDPAPGVQGITAQQAAEQLEALKAEYPGLNINNAQDAGSKLTGYEDARKALGTAAKDLGKGALVGPATKTLAVLGGFAIAAGTGAEITDAAGFVEAASIAVGAGGLLLGANEVAHADRRTNAPKPVRDALSATTTALRNAKSARSESRSAERVFRRSAPEITPSATRST